MVVYTFNPSAPSPRQVDLWVEASLIFKVSSRIAKATEKPFLDKQSKMYQKEKKKKRKVF